MRATATPLRRAGNGFTLIEMAMVLVIIGLLVGGFLVGKDLINYAERRTQITDIDKLNAAVNTFRLKYNCLPGDCSNVTSFFTSATQPDQVRNGNNNGLIDAMIRVSCGGCVDGTLDYWKWGTLYSLPESSSVMDHLAAAGLVDFAQYDETIEANLIQGVAFPRMKYVSKGSVYALHYGAATTDGGLLIGYQVYDADNLQSKPGHVFRLHMRQRDTSGHHVYSGTPSLQAWDAESLDKLIDDGKPFSGSVVVASDYGGASLSACGDSSTNTYRNTNNLPQSWGVKIELGCGLSVKAGF